MQTGDVVVMLKVTKKDIRDGEPGDDACCPMALAFRRSFRTTLGVTGSVSVGSRSAEIGRLTFPLTKKAIRWIHRFDFGGLVKPATFRLVGR